MIFECVRIIIRMITTILDTNVLIDAMADNYSYTWRIIDLVLQGQIKAVASHKIIKEYNLIIKRNVVRASDKQKLEKFINHLEIVKVTKRINAVPDDREDVREAYRQRPAGGRRDLH